MQHEVHVAVHSARQPRLAGRECSWTGDGFRVELAVLDHANIALALGHEHRAVGQERHAERE